MSFINYISTRAFLSYMVLSNTAAFLLFAYDKHQATDKLWRVRESTLCFSALAGGWVGGMTAMQLVHHKTKKQSFLQKYIACTAVNVVVGAVVLKKVFKIRNVTDLMKMARMSKMNGSVKNVNNAVDPDLSKKNFKNRNRIRKNS